ncbi:MAG TPA: hypothetical protein QGF58_21045 [Myxococcota bacterium]|nr:hypothetical protein [Myxococcota bacterium]
MTLGLAVACSAVEYRDADLQLDLLGDLPEEAEQIRVCVADVGEQTFGARLDGRFAVTGLYAEEAVDVTVDIVDVDDTMLERATVEGLTDYAEVEPRDCEGCEGCAEVDDFAAAGGETWVLAVRFR